MIVVSDTTPLSELAKVGHLNLLKSILQRQTGLDLGECAAIVLAEELRADRILIDELAARREALSRNLLVVGTLGILINAKARKLIPNVKEVLDTMIRNGKRVGEKLYAEILETAEES